MPKCRKCEKTFPNRIVINGKHRNICNRKYCLDCSPFDKHNTRRIELEKQNSSGELCRCKECNRVYEYQRNKGHTLDKCNSCHINGKRRNFKEKCLEYKGNKCTNCGYNKCKRALTFHHIDPKTKLFEIAGSHCRKWEKVVAELDKCCLLCQNCHSELHDTGH